MIIQVACAHRSCSVSNWSWFNHCPAEPGYSAFANSVDPDQLASSEANRSGSALFAIKHTNL